MTEPHVIILGGGPAGCGAAYRLRQLQKASVTLLEQQTVLGGNAGSFEFGNQYVDYGSHRLHHACDPDILADIQRLLGPDLRNRVRHGRIRLRGKWLHFPLKATDLMLRLDRAFAFGAGWDMVRRTLTGRRDGGDTFASVLRANLGPTICEHFYFPYARKIWGREPEELSGIQARKRVSAGSFTKLMKRLAKPPGAGCFYYPRKGYGQISTAYADAAAALGAKMELGTRVVAIRRPASDDNPWQVEVEQRGERRTLQADHIWSTIPIPAVARMMTPAPPRDVAEAANAIDYRAMVLVYLQLGRDQLTTTDAHYFPEEHISTTRLSEPKNYFGLGEPRGTTVLCAELPCSPEDPVWTMSDDDLARIVKDDMARAGLPDPGQPLRVMSRRLRQAYPIYTMGYERPLGVLDRWAESQPRFLSYGRQGLFAHDNTHHALYMAYCAVDCLSAGAFDQDQWHAHREVFATHVVED